jgi:hypothetical protein
MLEPPSNPFATRNVRPGALPFRFAHRDSPETIRARLSANAWCGQIVGPHGSGKTTLLRALAPHWEDWGRTLYELQHSQCRSMALGRLLWERLPPNSQWVIDGFEQLSSLQRWLLALGSCWRGYGLLVTCHHPVRLPTVWTSLTDVDLAWELVCALTPDGVHRPTPMDVRSAFEASNGNFRELFFQLYDRCQLSIEADLLTFQLFR